MNSATRPDRSVAGSQVRSTAPLAPSVYVERDRARAALAAATTSTSVLERYATAHVAALRGAAAVLAARPRPRPRRGRQQRSAWALLDEVEPSLAAWSAFFASGAAKRAAAEAGLARMVSDADATALVVQVGQFLDEVEQLLGLPRGATPDARQEALLPRAS